MSHVKNFVLRMMDKPRTVVYTAPTGNVLSVASGGYAFYIKTSALRTIDSINAPRHKVGRKIQLIAHISNANNITVRDNQSGSNLSIVGTSLNLGAGDSITFRADLDSDGNKVWIQDGALVNV